MALEHIPARRDARLLAGGDPGAPLEQDRRFQEEAIRVIRDTIELPLLYPELYARFGKRQLKGIPPLRSARVGKTLLGKATAYNLMENYRRRLGRDVKEWFLLINGPQILNMARRVRAHGPRSFAQERETSLEGQLCSSSSTRADHKILRSARLGGG